MVKYYKKNSFSIASNGYFISNNKQFKERLLHRIIWIDNFGEIPMDYHVHHVNGNTIDNRIENLQLKPGSEHLREHAIIQMSRLENRIKAKKVLDRVRNKAIEVHKRLYGTPEFYRKRAYMAWENRTKKGMICNFCNKPYKTFFPLKSKFCSPVCQGKASRARIKKQKEALSNV